MVKGMAVVGGPEVRFNALVIGSVDNGEATLKAGYTQEMLVELNQMFVMKRRGQPREIAYAMMYLMSDAAAWVTGTQLVINGGGIYQSKMPKSRPAG
jgi:NAD(P)-dependent dehydrogenase (short-subunit alcohol dehydrogenase family)